MGRIGIDYHGRDRLVPIIEVLVRADKRFEKCPRKNVDLDDWYQTTARDFPESRQRKTFSPEGPPTIDCASVGIEEFGEFPDSSRRRTLPHGGDQDDDSAEINLSAEKTNRRARRPLAASVTPVRAVGDCTGLTTRGSRGVGRMICLLFTSGGIASAANVTDARPPLEGFELTTSTGKSIRSRDLDGKVSVATIIAANSAFSVQLPRDIQKKSPQRA